MKNIIVVLVLYTVMITIYAAPTIEEDHVDISELRNRRQTDYYDYEGDFTDQDYDAAEIARTANNRRTGRNKGENQRNRNAQISKKGQKGGNTKSRKQNQRPTNATRNAVNRKGRAIPRRANKQQGRGRSRSPGRKS